MATINNHDFLPGFYIPFNHNPDELRINPKTLETLKKCMGDKHQERFHQNTNYKPGKTLLPLQKISDYLCRN